MKKTPISRITFSDVTAQPFSPLVWNGKEFVILKGAGYNLKNLQNEVNALKTNVAEDLRVMRENFDASLKLLDRAKEQVSKQEEIIVQIEEVQTYTYPVLQSLITLGTRNALLHSAIKKSVMQIMEAETLADSIQSGKMFQIIGNNATVGMVDGSYVLGVDAERALITSGDDVATITYHSAINTYEIGGGLTGLASNVYATEGLETKTSADGKAVTVAINEKLLSGGNGVSVDFTGTTYNVSLSPDLVRQSGDTGILVSTNSAGQIVLDLSADIVGGGTEVLGAGYGIEILGKTLSVKRDILPKLYSSSSGVIVQKIGTLPDTYQISFDAGLENLNPEKYAKAVVSTSSLLRTEYNPNTNTYMLGLDYSSARVDPLLKPDFNSRLDALAVKALEHYSRQKIEFDTISSGFKEAYLNGFVKMFSFLVGDYNASGVLPVNATNRENLERFGQRANLVTVKGNVAGFYETGGSGFGAVVGSEIEIDLYLLLEEKLRTDYSDPTFTILDSERGTKYKLVEVDTKNISSTFDKQEDFRSLDYSSGYSLLFMSRFSQNESIADLIDATVCQPIVLSNFYSSTYNSIPLQVTCGDVDFIVGNRRMGQLNATPMTPSVVLTEARNIIVRAMSQVEDANGITTTMTIQDTYTSALYEAKWQKMGGRTIDSDFMSEVSGATNPNHIRVFARLKANYELSDADTNRLVYALCTNQLCFAKFCSQFIMLGVLEGRVYSPDFMRTEFLYGGFFTKSGESKVDYENGKVKVSIKNSILQVTLAELSIIDILKNLTIAAQFRLAPIAIDFEDSLLRGCWTVGEEEPLDRNASCSQFNQTGYRVPFENPESLI